MKLHSIMVFIAILAASAADLSAQEVSARAEVSPQVVMVGETATYSVTFTNTSRVPNLNTPRVEGLDFNDYMSTSTMQRIINGRASIEVRASWTFQPVRTGRFTIPGRTLSFNNEEVAIPSVQVEAAPPSEEARTRAFLRLDMPEGPFFVGEALSARLSLFVRRDLSVSNIEFPVSSGDAFIHSEFRNNPARMATQVNGRPYEVLAWDILVTPIKAGPAELVFSQNIAVQIPVEDNRFPSLFSMRQTRQEVYGLSSDPVSTEILPIPVENRPDSFQDAVGQFSVSAQLSTRDLRVGEPLTLTLSLEGRGNFDRIPSPELPEWEDWRQYPPKATFTPTDQLGREGRKSFEYILIPQSEKITEVPEFAYSTFDPKAAAYRTTLIEAEPVTVKPSLGPAGPEPLSLLSPGTAAKESRIPESILSLRPEPGHLTPPGGPVWKRPAYWIGNGLTGLCLLVVGSWQYRRNRLRRDVRLTRRHEGSRKIRKALQQAAEAAKAGQSQEFFEAARFCLQEQVSHLASQPPDARTLVTSDCLALLDSANAPEDIRSRARSLLEAADTHQFAGIEPDSGQLKALQATLESLIPDLNRIRK